MRQTFQPLLKLNEVRLFESVAKVICKKVKKILLKKKIIDALVYGLVGAWGFLREPQGF